MQDIKSGPEGSLGKSETDELQLTKAQLVTLAQKTKQLLAANQQLKTERDAAVLKLQQLESASIVIHTSTSASPKDGNHASPEQIIAARESELENLRQQLTRLQEQDNFLRVQLQHQDGQITEKSLKLTACEQQKVALEQQIQHLTSTLSTKEVAIIALEQTVKNQNVSFQHLTDKCNLLEANRQTAQAQKENVAQEDIINARATIHELEAKLQAKEKQLVSANEVCHTHRGEMDTYRDHVDELTQTVTSLRTELAAAQAVSQQKATLDQERLAKESLLEQQVARLEAELSSQAVQHQETVRKLTDAASEEKKMMIDELLKEKQLAQTKDKELVDLKDLLGKTKAKLRETLAAHARIEAEARTKHDLLQQLETDLREAQLRLATETENLRKALTKVQKLQKRGKDRAAEAQAREQQLWDKNMQLEQIGTEQRAQIATLEQTIDEQKTMIETLETEKKDAKRELLVKATAMEVLEREVVRITGVLCGLQNQKRELVGTLQRALKR